PGDQRVDVLRFAAGAFDDGPAVVRPRLDVVELVPGVLAELGGVHVAVRVPVDALDVPVAPRVDQGALERIVLGHRPVRFGAKDLPAQALEVLRVVGVVRVPGGDVELAVGAEGEAAAVVVDRGGDAGDDRLGIEVLDGEAHHPVVLVGRVVGVDVAVLFVGRRYGQAEQSAFVERAFLCRNADAADDLGGAEAFVEHDG